MIYSHSKLDNYRNCPLSFKLRYIDGVKSEREGAEAFMGSRVHEALEQLYRDWRMCKYASEEDVVREYLRLWDAGWHDDVVVVRKQYTPEHYRAVGEKAIRAYYRRYHPFDDGATVWLEKKVNIPLDPDGQYRMSGVVDRLVARNGGVYEIHDYKTSQYLPDQAQADADRQLALYQLAVQDAFPDAREVKLIWHYLVFDKEVESRRTPAQLEELKKETIELIREIEACEDFPPKEGFCDWCEYQHLCPLRKHLFAVESLPPREFAEDEGVILADRYSEVWAREKEAAGELTELKKDVVAYCKQHGVERVRGTSSVLSVRIEREPRFPGTSDEERAGLEEAIRVMGKWEEMTSLNISRLSRVYKNKELPEGQLSLLDPFVTWEESFTVNVRKLKEPVD